MRRKTIIGLLFLFLTLLGISAYFITKQLNSVRRDIPTLLNYYYRYKESSPWQAKQALDLILVQNPKYLPAIYALSAWYIQQGDTNSALAFLEKYAKQLPNDARINFELAKLYIMNNNKSRAKEILKRVIKSNNSDYQLKAKNLYQLVFPEEALASKTEQLVSYIAPAHINTIDLTPLFQKAQEMSTIQPDLARDYLNLILTIDPNAQEAYLRLGYLEIEHNPQIALQHFQKAFTLKPSPELAMQIGYLLVQNKDNKQAQLYFEFVLAHGHGTIVANAQRAIAYLSEPNLPAPTGALLSALPEIAKPLSLKERLLQLFYSSKQKNPAQAWRAINQLLHHYPRDIQLLKEAAYFAENQKKPALAIAFWKQAYAIEKNPEYALSLAYLYNNLNFQWRAFYYFGLATKTPDKNLRYKAEMGMTNLGGAQTKFLPDPYFAEFYSAPFYFSRFDLAVVPLISRLGVTLNKKYRTEAYLSYRRTKDDRSGSNAIISQIFEDNVAIYSAGLRSYPFINVPLQMFIEAGKAQDLVFRNRPTWREDLRAGLVYFNAWGAKPDFTFKLEFPLKWRATLYGDLIYYSRYDDNVIGTTWFRPGLRAATMQSAALDVYLANYLLLDKNHEFYNNVYSVGPGVAFQPSNRWNFVFRFESLQGFYIPVNSPTPNPYRSKYYNNVASLEVFFRF